MAEAAQVDILAAVVQEADNLKYDTPDVDFEQQLWRLLDAASPRWATTNLPDDDAAQRGAFMRLVLSGQIQLRMDVLARGLLSEPRVRANVIVTGNYTKVLARHIRSAVPEFKGRLAVTPQLPVEYRLSRAGQETQKEIREFGGGEMEEGFLLASLGFVIPGTVNIHNLVYEEQKPSDTAGASGTTGLSPEPKKRPRTTAWPRHKTEGHVSAYLDRKKHLYRKLAGDVIDGMPGAYEVFRKEFGCSAIAAAITKKVGTKAHRACGKKDVEKTQAYSRQVKPLLKNPPERPDDWEAMLDSGHGEALPDILEETPFEDDES